MVTDRGLVVSFRQGPKYKVRGYTQLAPNGTVAFLHRSAFTKYDPHSDEGRPSTHLTIELTGVCGKGVHVLGGMRW